MAAFAYKAINKSGKSKSGVLEGDNARQIRQQLREQQLIPLEVEQVAEKERRSAKQFSLFTVSYTHLTLPTIYSV